MTKPITSDKCSITPPVIRQYNCSECGDFDVIHSNSENITGKCPHCNSVVKHYGLANYSKVNNDEHIGNSKQTSRT